jgi:hypothetical protein
MVYHTSGNLKLHRSSIYENVGAVFGFNPAIMTVFNLVLHPRLSRIAKISIGQKTFGRKDHKVS